MRAAIIAALILILPAALVAEPAVGIYASNSTSANAFATFPYGEFSGYVIATDLGCFITGAEFSVVVPSGIVVTGFSIPYENSLTIGDPIGGLAITYWPPLDGVMTSSSYLAKIEFLALPEGACTYYGGETFLAPMSIVADPRSGFLRFACYPNADLFNMTGLTSVVCPEAIATEETSWGAIKSLF